MRETDTGPILVANTSARFILKQKTQVIHQQLESLSRHKRIFATDYTLDEYGQLLTDYIRVLHVYDEALTAVDWGAFQPYTPRTAFLFADLHALKKPLPRLNNLSFDFDIYGWWGVRYVLEGMSLGGKVILKNAPIFRQKEAKVASCFFSFESFNWPEFCKNIDVVLAENEHLLKAACSAHSVLESMLDQLAKEDEPIFSVI